jgi:serralysin
MLSRRTFLSTCCAIHAFPAAGQPRPAFICGTVDRDASPDMQTIIDRFSSNAGSGRFQVEAVVNDSKFTPYGTANLDHRWLRSDGLTPNTNFITLGVHFFNGTADQRTMVEKAANVWLVGDLGTRLKFEFGVDQSRAQISIHFGAEGNNSIVGRESATYAKTRPSMRLQDMYEYIVTHEFGHALGLQHEHQNPATAIKWHRAAVIADMASQGWTPQMCEQNIFSRFSKQYACIGSPTFDAASIMLYPIPSHWTEDGYSTSTNTAVSTGDAKCVVGLYRA